MFVHIKGALRDATVRGHAPLGAVMYPAALWYKEAGHGVPHQYKRLIDIRNSTRGHTAIVRKHLRRQQGNLDKIEAAMMKAGL